MFVYQNIGLKRKSQKEIAMRELTYDEVCQVSGGASLAQLALNACKGLPNSATVTVEQSLGGSLGYDSTNTNNQTRQSATVNCGDLRGGGAGSGGGSSGSSGSWGGGSSGASGSWGSKDFFYYHLV